MRRSVVVANHAFRLPLHGAGRIKKFLLKPHKGTSQLPPFFPGERRTAMAKESKGQKDTVGRVMHEYKHGELETGTGKPVKSRKQAVAIALNEAGASNKESPEKNREHLSKTKQKERKGKTAKQQKEGHL
jgi:hypothetical protein